jgi:hypothetical protein
MDLAEGEEVTENRQMAVTPRRSRRSRPRPRSSSSSATA